jgi:hypothetical protein
MKTITNRILHLAILVGLSALLGCTAVTEGEKMVVINTSVDENGIYTYTLRTTNAVSGNLAVVGKKQNWDIGDTLTIGK